MALRALMLGKQIRELNARLDEMRKAKEAFATREAELTAAIEETSTEEEQKTVEDAVTEFESEKAANDDAIAKAEEEKAQLEQELADLEAKQEKRAAEPPAPVERTVEHPMSTRVVRFAEMSMEQRAKFVEREDVKEFLTRLRELGKTKRAVSGGDLLIPDNVLPLIRLEVERNSKLLPLVNLKHLKGTARQPMTGVIPEAIWLEMVGALSEIEIAFNAVEIDGYKVGAYIAVPNATLEDSDINLANEVITALGISIAKSVDKAMISGDGTKQPLGIKTRLAQTSKPSNWEVSAPEWTNLSTSHILAEDLSSLSGAEFFAKLIGMLGVASPDGSATKGCFWAMNRKTHLDIMTKALAFNSAAALVAQNTNTFPIVGGTIIELDNADLADCEIVGGFGDLYLMVERAGAKIGSSEHVRYIEDQTVFKGTARYDGKPVRGEAFVDVIYGAEG